MVQNDISTWLQFALQQIAAESYLGGIDWNNPIALRDALVQGNNRQGVVEQNNTRMSVINIQRGRESVLDVLRYASPKLSAREESSQGPCRFLSPSLIGGGKEQASVVRVLPVSGGKGACNHAYPSFAGTVAD